MAKHFDSRIIRKFLNSFFCIHSRVDHKTSKYGLYKFPIINRLVPGYRYSLTIPNISKTLYFSTTNAKKRTQIEPTRVRISRIRSVTKTPPRKNKTKRKEDEIRVPKNGYFS